jgi:hypothetical protein
MFAGAVALSEVAAVAHEARDDVVEDGALEGEQVRVRVIPRVGGVGAEDRKFSATKGTSSLYKSISIRSCWMPLMVRCRRTHEGSSLPPCREIRKLVGLWNNFFRPVLCTVTSIGRVRRLLFSPNAKVLFCKERKGMHVVEF